MAALPTTVTPLSLPPSGAHGRLFIGGGAAGKVAARSQREIAGLARPRGFPFLAPLGRGRLIGMATRDTPFTEQQRAAIERRDVSIALSAGAGCGKTFVLTQRFLRHLEPPSQPARLRSLVAITFTERAAREMRDRIRHACQQRLTTRPAEEITHWQQVLRGLDAARISTIHSFCATLLRTYAVEAAIDPRFSVLEPPLADTLLHKVAVEVVHDKLIEDDPNVTSFVLHFGLQETYRLGMELARQTYRLSTTPWDDVTPEELVQRWRTAWHDEFLPKVQRRFREGPAVRNILTLARAHDGPRDELTIRLREVAARLEAFSAATDASGELAALRALAQVKNVGKQHRVACPDEYEAVKTAFKTLRDEIDRLQTLLKHSDDHHPLAAELALKGIHLARSVEAAYAAAKRAGGVLDFDDLLFEASRLLHRHESVRQRFAASIDLLMVDEFQDTDPIQADIVRQLCGAALATGRLFVVGDPKQSIYRFRRADPHVFQTISRELPPNGQLSLTRNFRSQPEILKFVNYLFGTTFAGYEPLVPHVPQVSPPPCVEFLWATSDPPQSAGGEPQLGEEDAWDDTEAAEETSASAPDKVSAVRLRRREAVWLARRIAELLRDPVPRIRADAATNSLRRVEPRDIVVLFRSLTNIGVYEAALREYGLEYYLVGGKAFYAQQEVFDVLNMCRCLEDPDDSAALVGVLRSPWFGCSDDALQALRPESGDWWSALRQPPPPYLPEVQRERLRFAARVLTDLRERKDRLPIAELLNTAIAQTGYDAALLAEHLGSRKVANLRKLIESAAAFDRSEQCTLKDYVRRLQTSVFEEIEEEFATTQPEAGDVIRLMSVHQAKGLEFPVVFVADVNRKPQPPRCRAVLHGDWGAVIRLPDKFGEKLPSLPLAMWRLQEQEADDEEALRLLYVATTRAKDLLVLSAGIEPDLQPANPWMRLLAQQFSLELGTPRGDPWLGTLGGATQRDALPAVRVHRTIPAGSPMHDPRPHRPLVELAPTLWSAAPRELPASARTFAPDYRAAGWWSVSQLEAQAALLFPELRSQHGSRGELGSAEAIGTLIHAVLQQVDCTQRDDWERHLERCARLAAPNLEEHHLAVVRELLRKWAQSEVSARLAAARQLLREVDFVMPWLLPDRSGPDMISGQIDCCYEDAAGLWHILDYKTGDYTHVRSDTDLVAPYRLQLGLYALASEQWLGKPPASVSLVVFRPRMRLIAYTVDAAAREQLHHWVTAAIRGLSAPCE
jgi:ATP-dependent helicase/nuclease subunit A